MIVNLIITEWCAYIKLIYTTIQYPIRTMNFFVCIILSITGRDYCRANNLLPLSDGFDDNYDAFLNPTTFTSFTAAAYRGLHSYIQGSME